MTLEPILSAPTAIQIHLATVIPAFAIGTWQIFFSTKGARTHRVLGYTYLVLMSITAVAALFIQEVMRDGPFWGFSPIHLLVPLTLFAVVGAIRGARTRNIRMHRFAMVSLYVGGILIAGAFTFIPGRLMYRVFFG
jgi:uncharacterized membrane protein